MNAIDIVIPYVDATDPEWQERYRIASGKTDSQENCRFRNWDNFQYLFRGIEKNMPWVQRVHLVIQSESQIPNWLNTENDKLHIVYHDDYIPSELLPTFNTNAIELFMHRIPGIATRFIIFNDDVFPLAPLEVDNFFDGLKPRIAQKSARIGSREGQYWEILRNNIRVLRQYYPQFTGYRNAHITHNILKPVMDEIVERCLPIILDGLRVSKLRDGRNCSIQLVKDYTVLTHRASIPNIKSAELCLSDGKRIGNPKAQIVCCNDNEEIINDFKRLKADVNTYLQKKLPEKSSFEK